MDVSNSNRTISQYFENRNKEEIVLVSDVPDTESQDFVCSCYVNCAACFLRQRMLREADFSCSKALELQPRNAKALFRRAQARHALDTTEGLQSAICDLEVASHSAPTNTDIRNLLATMKVLRTPPIEAPQLCRCMVMQPPT